MNSLTLNNFNPYPLSFVQDHVVESLQAVLKNKIILVSLMAFSCLAALFIIFRYCCAGDDVAVEGETPYGEEVSYLVVKDSVVPKAELDKTEYAKDDDAVKWEPPIEPKAEIDKTEYADDDVALEWEPPFEPKAELDKTENVKNDVTVEEETTYSGVLSHHVVNNPSELDKVAQELDALHLAEFDKAVSFTLDEEQAHIELIKNRWLENPSKEKIRLISAQVLPYPEEGMRSQLNGIMFNDQAMAVMGRVLELKKFYRKTHYVFTHGQATQWSVANQLINEMVHTFTPHWYHPLKIPFRMPYTGTYATNAKSFITANNADKDTFVDDNQNEIVLSVDAQFWNTDNYESALYFFEKNSNINLNKHNELHKVFKSIFVNYLPNETESTKKALDAISHKLAERACKLAKEKALETKVGTLYAICVPKEIVKDKDLNFAYRCHPFGVECKCHGTKDSIDLLEQMQANNSLICSGGRRAQYRLVTSRLTEEKDVRSFGVDALATNRRTYYSEQIKELVNEARLYSLLFDLLETMDQDPSVFDQIQCILEDSPQIDKQLVQNLLFEKGAFA